MGHRFGNGYLRDGRCGLPHLEHLVSKRRNCRCEAQSAHLEVIIGSVGHPIAPHQCSRCRPTTPVGRLMHLGDGIGMRCCFPVIDNHLCLPRTTARLFMSLDIIRPRVDRERIHISRYSVIKQTRCILIRFAVRIDIRIHLTPCGAIPLPLFHGSAGRSYDDPEIGIRNSNGTGKIGEVAPVIDYLLDLCTR